MEWKHTYFLVKKKFMAQQLVKKVLLTVFYYMKRPITIDFYEEGATVLFLANSLDKIHHFLNDPCVYVCVSSYQKKKKLII